MDRESCSGLDLVYVTESVKKVGLRGVVANVMDCIIVVSKFEH